jgi:hypothetical protein
MASIAECVDDPSGIQRGAAGEGEPVSFRSEVAIRPTCSCRESARHNDARRAARRAIAPTRGGRGAATQVLAQVD